MSAWTLCVDALPVLAADRFGDLESDWLLARDRRGVVYVARLTQATDQEDLLPVWFARGGENRDLRDVVEWTEIPA